MKDPDILELKLDLELIIFSNMSSNKAVKQIYVIIN